MAVLDTHGLKMTGLKKASGETQNYPNGCYSGQYDEIFYDRKTGEVWTIYQYSLGQNAWTKYDNPAVIKICNTSRHMTMQEIADAIKDAVDAHAAVENVLAGDAKMGKRANRVRDER